MSSPALEVPAGSDPMRDNPVSCIPARWVCNVPGMKCSNWLGSVIAWPSWAAYECNARAGHASRTVYSKLDGRVLYPYMGPWASGGKVTVIRGEVLIIEWKRGSEVWRETRLGPGDSYTIGLLAHEDNAMIEAPNGETPEFTVRLENFKPQRIRPQPAPLPPYMPES